MSDHDPIEEALKKLRPAELDNPLMARLTAARTSHDVLRQKSALREVLVRWLLPVAVSACVAVATFAVLEHHRAGVPPGMSPQNTVATETPVPVGSQDFLVSARPVGVVVAPNQQPYRIMDVEWLEYQAVRESADGPVLHTATTRRDVIPIALETY